MPNSVSRTKYKALGVVFAGEPEDLVACVCRLAVLYEDLRLELTEAGKPEGREARRIYFIRRSVATLREFVEALLHLDGLASFVTTKRGFDQATRGRWNTEISNLRHHKERIYNFRNIFGGHFSYDAALYAARNAEPGVQWPLEFHWDLASETAGPTLGFAEAIATLALFRERGEMAPRPYAQDLFEMSLSGYQSATWCVAVVVRNYLAPRFGF